MIEHPPAGQLRAQERPLVQAKRQEPCGQFSRHSELAPQEASQKPLQVIEQGASPEQAHTPEVHNSSSVTGPCSAVMSLEVLEVCVASASSAAGSQLACNRQSVKQLTLTRR